MKRLFATLCCFAVLVSLSGLLIADEQEGAKEFAATCPVSGADASEEQFVEKNGKKTYFCCEKCAAAYEKDPKKFAEGARLQMLETGQIIQVGCHISGGPVNEETMVEVGHTKVGFCCEKCQAKFEKAGDDEKLKVLFAKLDKGFTLQTKCPISGKPINPKATAEHEGKKVYFCCEKCPKAFAENPGKYAANLPKVEEDAAE